MLKNWWRHQQTKRKLKKFRKAVELCDSLGYSVVKMYEIGGTMYIEDQAGTRYTLKSQNKKRGKKQ